MSGDAACPNCGRAWDEIAPDGHRCRRCNIFIPREAQPVGAVAAAGRNGNHPAEAKEILDSRLTHSGNRENREIEKPHDDHFRLTTIADLLAEPEEAIDCIWEGRLPTGGVSIDAAKPKVGKSTFARNLALTVARGEPFLGGATLQGPVVYLALEEKRGEVAKHFARMGAVDEAIYIHVGAAPEEALAALQNAIQAHGARLAIVDPALKLIRLRDANDYAEVSRALEPVIELARETGCHIHLVHHLGKGDRIGGDAILGSTALFGAVDTAILMKQHGQQRTVETIQRYGDDLPETVITLDGETGRLSAAGELAAVQLEEAAKAVLEAVTKLSQCAAEEEEGEHPTEADIKDEVGGNQTTAAKALRHLLNGGRLTRTGSGRRGDPYRYALTNVGLGSQSEPGPFLDSRFTGFPYIENRVIENLELPSISDTVASVIARAEAEGRLLRPAAEGQEDEPNWRDVAAFCSCGAPAIGLTDEGQPACAAHGGKRP